MESAQLVAKGFKKPNQKKRCTISSYVITRQVTPMDVMANCSAVFHVSVGFLAGMEQEKMYISVGLPHIEREITDLLITKISVPKGREKGLSVQ